jgi:hypothetical protein
MKPRARWIQIPSMYGPYWGWHIRSGDRYVYGQAPFEKLFSMLIEELTK